MGFLDDAIREHLDLKRRRGADPTDIERAEREALGPVRRDPFEHADDDPEAALEVGQEGAYDQTAEPDYEYEPEPVADAPPLPEDRPPEPYAEEDFDEDEPFAEEASSPAPRVTEAPVDEETVEYDVEETFGEGREAPPPAHDRPEHGDDDVLEETPEFLQDAPEHDRLWFEQRPPRDFDFDG